MGFRRRLLSSSLIVVIALLAGMSLPAESRAQKKAKSSQPAPKKEKAAVLTEQVKFDQAAMLRKAFVLLAEWNHDYNGHRVHAMHALKAGLKILDESVMKNGTAEQKAATVEDVAAAARAEEAGKLIPTIHERQPASEAQLRKAAALMAEVRPTLVTHKQHHVLKHVDKGVDEIKIALAIR